MAHHYYTTSPFLFVEDFACKLFANIYFCSILQALPCSLSSSHSRSAAEECPPWAPEYSTHFHRFSNPVRTPKQASSLLMFLQSKPCQNSQQPDQPGTLIAFGVLEHRKIPDICIFMPGFWGEPLLICSLMLLFASGTISKSQPIRVRS